MCMELVPCIKSVEVISIAEGGKGEFSQLENTKIPIIPKTMDPGCSTKISEEASTVECSGGLSHKLRNVVNVNQRNGRIDQPANGVSGSMKSNID